MPALGCSRHLSRMPVLTAEAQRTQRSPFVFFVVKECRGRPACLPFKPGEHMGSPLLPNPDILRQRLNTNSHGLRRDATLPVVIERNNISTPEGLNRQARHDQFTFVQPLPG